MIKNQVKKIAKKIPGAKRIAAHFGLAGPPSFIAYSYKRINLSEKRGFDLQLHQIKNMINYCKTTQSSDDSYDGGYHNVSLKGLTIKGRRDPWARLEVIDYEFSGKTVLDIGCNQGGMLFSLADSIKFGVGIDYEPRAVNICHAIRSVNEISNLNFYVFDLDRDPIENILDLIPGSGVDVTFLLAVCQHIKKWKEVIAFVASISPTLVFEANGTDDQKSQQSKELKKYYKKCRIVYEKSVDDGADRMLWIAQN